MTKSAEYIQFEEGFLKEAEANGCDIDFLRGYIKEADDITDMWKAAFDEMAEKSGDPLYKVKLAMELASFSNDFPELLKQAGFEDMANSAMSGWGDFSKNLGQGLHLDQAQGWLQKQNLGPMINNALRNNPNLLSSLVAGGGGGGLLGLLMGALTGHPMMGMMGGALGGAGLGAYAGNSYLRNYGFAHTNDPSDPALNENQNANLATGFGPTVEDNRDRVEHQNNFKNNYNAVQAGPGGLANLMTPGPTTPFSRAPFSTIPSNVAPGGKPIINPAMQSAKPKSFHPGMIA